MDGSAYAGERTAPPALQCLNLALSFDGRKLVMTGGTKPFSYPGVSGRPAADGAFDYSVTRQMQKDLGPIPEGRFWINPSQMWMNHWYSVARRSAWGNYRITIHPNADTQTFGRGGFFIHGGDTPGSAGCIDLTGAMDRFRDDLLREVGAGQNCQLPLTVNYNLPGDYPVPVQPDAAYV